MMKRRDFLTGVAAAALVGPKAAAEMVHTFKAVDIGSPTAARITMVMDEYSPENLAAAFMGVTLVKQANGGWLINGGEHVSVGQSFTFDPGHEGPVQLAKPVA